MSAFVLALMTACVWGVVPILEKAGLAKTPPIVGLFYRCVGVLLGALILGLFVIKPAALRAVDVKSVALLAFAGLLASFLGQFIFYHALKAGEVSKMVPISGAYPLVTFIIGVLVFKEAFTPAKAAGVAMVVLGIWLLR